MSKPNTIILPRKQIDQPIKLLGIVNGNYLYIIVGDTMVFSSRLEELKQDYII